MVEYIIYTILFAGLAAAATYICAGYLDSKGGKTAWILWGGMWFTALVFERLATFVRLGNL